MDLLAFFRTAEIAAPYPNPTGGREWYHGTPQHFDAEPGQSPHAEGYAEDTESPPATPDRQSSEYFQHAGKHWNTDLGTHWTSMRHVAHTFAQPYGATDESRVASATLHMANPKHYTSEHDMAAHAISWAKQKGWRHLPETDEDQQHFRNGEVSEMSDDKTATPTGGEHVDYQDHVLAGTPMSDQIARIDNDDPKDSPQDLRDSHSGDRLDGYLSHHPFREEITSGFKKHLMDQGHDGVIYGNEYEGPKGHKCAVPFHDEHINLKGWKYTKPDSPNAKPQDQPQRETNGQQWMLKHHESPWGGIERWETHDGKFASKVASADDMPPAPGTAPIPDDHVRLWHYTHPDNAASIKEQGLLESHARGDGNKGAGNEPSAGVWASTRAPSDEDRHMRPYVEFHAHPSEISDRADRPPRPSDPPQWGTPKEWAEGYHHVIMRGSVAPERILGVHEPWHETARYIRDNGGAEKFSWLEGEADPGSEEMKAYQHVKKHGSAEPAPSVDDLMDLLGTHAWNAAMRPEKTLTDLGYTEHHSAPGRAHPIAHETGEGFHVPTPSPNNPPRKGYYPGEDLAGMDKGPNVAWVKLEHLKAMREYDRRDPAEQTYDSDGTIEQQKREFQEHGQREPGLISHDPHSDRARLIEGNHRIAAAEELGWPALAVHVVRATRHEFDSSQRHVYLGSHKVTADRNGYTPGNLHPRDALPDHMLYEGDAGLRPKTAAVWEHPEPKWQKTPGEDEGSDEWMDRRDVHREAERTWEHQTRKALSRGDLSNDQAAANGYRSVGHDRGEGKFGTGAGLSWKPMPHDLYHVTTDLAGALTHGLKSRRDLGQSYGKGLGGGEDDTISLTDNEQLAHHILDSMKEFHDVVNGRKTPAHMWDEAQQGTGAARPFHQELAKSLAQVDGKHGRAFDAVIHGRTLHQGLHTQEEMDARGDGKWEPHPEADSFDTKAGAMHNVWHRPSTPEEKTHDAVDFYKTFSMRRETAGGRPDPVFFSTDTKGFAAMDPKNFGIIKAHPKPKAAGYQMGGMNEWRTCDGDALDLTHHKTAARRTLSWDQVKSKYPAYAAYGMDHAVNEFNDDGSGDMTTPHLRFTEEHVDPRDVRFQRYPEDDERTSSLRDGYTKGASIPPVLLVKRAGELLTVDGHHRLSDHESQGRTQVPAVIAHSTLETPYTGRAGLGFTHHKTAAAKKPYTLITEHVVPGDETYTQRKVKRRGFDTFAEAKEFGEAMHENDTSFFPNVSDKWMDHPRWEGSAWNGPNRNGAILGPNITRESSKANPLDGYDVQHQIRPHEMYPDMRYHDLIVRDPDGYMVGSMSWNEGDHSGRPNQIGVANVEPQHRRKGIATELLRRAREITPDLQHSQMLSPDGKAWSAKVARWLPHHKTAAAGRQVHRGVMVEVGHEEARDALDKGTFHQLLADKVGGYSGHIFDYGNPMMEKGEHSGKPGAGIHWTDDPDVARTFSHRLTEKPQSLYDGFRMQIPVVLHGSVSRKHVETDPDVLSNGSVYGHGYEEKHAADEQEVPIKRGAPVQVHSMEAALPDGDLGEHLDHHYDMDWGSREQNQSWRSLPHSWQALDVAPHHVTARWLPRARIFEPGKGGLDPRLFNDKKRMKPEVAAVILGDLDAFWHPTYPDWRDWCRVYLAGSEASEWYGNNDFDTLLGVDHKKIRRAHPEFAAMLDEDIDDYLTKGLREHLNDEDWTAPWDGEVWHRTFFVNPNSWDIRDIKPYAAYDITRARWIVEPIHPAADWGPEKLPSAYWDEMDSIIAQVHAIEAMPEPIRTGRGAALYDYLHSDRRRAFGPHGTGVYDPGNAVWKALDMHPDRPLAALIDLKRKAANQVAAEATA